MSDISESTPRENDWSDREKHAVSLVTNTTGWGIAACVAFCGWLVGGLDLDWVKNEALCWITWGAILAVGGLWIASVNLLLSRTKQLLLDDQAVTLWRALPVFAVAITLAIAMLASFD